MNTTHGSLVKALLMLSVALIAGCSDSLEPAAPTEPAATTTGTLEIRISTDSANVAVDPGGYTLVVDAGAGQPVAANGTVTIAALATGQHLVRLDGLAPNYAIHGSNPRWVDVGTATAPSLPVSLFVSRVTTDCAGCWDY